MSKLLRIITTSNLAGILGLGFFIENSKNQNKYILSDGKVLDKNNTFDLGTQVDYENSESEKRVRVYQIKTKDSEEIIYDFGNGKIKYSKRHYITPNND